MEAQARNKRALIALAGFLIVILAVVVFVRFRSGNPHPISSLVKSPPLPVRHSDTVKPNFVHTYTLDISADHVPGTLSGSWDCKGKSAGIKGAIDDTLIAFRLKGANNEVLQQMPDHPRSGNFSLRVTRPGRYTFEFDNGGILRATPRQVSIDGTYQPD